MIPPSSVLVAPGDHHLHRLHDAGRRSYRCLEWSCPESCGGTGAGSFGCCPGVDSGSHLGYPGYLGYDVARHDEGWGCAFEGAEAGKGGAREETDSEEEARENPYPPLLPPPPSARPHLLHLPRDREPAGRRWLVPMTTGEQGYS